MTLAPLTWTTWEPLRDSWRRGAVPAEPGLYRIRQAGSAALDYIGQPGAGSMTLRRRLAMLKGAFGEVMPYREAT